MDERRPKLIDPARLRRSGVVANCAMNRGRKLTGANSYARDLSFDIDAFLRARLGGGGEVAWLDIACGEGRALVEAAARLGGEASAGRLAVVGVDLAGMFAAASPPAGVRLVETAFEDFAPARKFDLVTCVHGLHYFGDKLALLEKAARLLENDGFFAANLDPRNLKLSGAAASNRRIFSWLRSNGFRFDPKKRLLTLSGGREFEVPFIFAGADDRAGPNYTGQPAVDSYYAPPA